MNPKNILQIGAALVVASAATHARLAAADITVTWDSFEQKIYGFGGNIALGGENAVEADDLYGELFGSGGLKVSFLRVPNWYDMRSQSVADYDAKARNVATTMKKFRDWQPNGKIIMTAWTPPPYLKVNNQLKASSSGDTTNRIKPYANSTAHNYPAYAWWWVYSLRFYRDFGGASGSNAGTLPDYVSIQNEPDNNVSSWESCLFTNYEDSSHASYSRALAATRDIFDANGLSTQKLAGPDIAQLDISTATVHDASSFFSYVNRHGENDPDKVDLGDIDAVAHHIYGDKDVGTFRAVNDEFPATDPYLPKFQTEYKVGGANNMVAPKTPDDFMDPAKIMHNCLRHEKVNAYMVWDLIWGCLRKTGTVDSAGNNVWVPNNGEYYALGHYSKFINPNDWCVTSNDEGGVWATAYRQYKGSGIKDRLIVVMLNTNSSTTSATIVGKLKSGSAYDYWDATASARTLKVYRTSGVGTGQQRLGLVESVSGSSLSGSRSFSLPAQSITTVIID